MATTNKIRECAFPHSSRAESFDDFEATHFRTAAWARFLPDTPDEVRLHHNTIVHAFAYAAKLEESRGVLLYDGRSATSASHRSYRQLFHDARRFAHGLAAAGVRERDRVLIILPTGFEFIAAFFGTQLLRAVPVPAYPPDPARLVPSMKRLEHIARSSGATVCVTWSAMRSVIGAIPLRVHGLRHILFVEELAEHPKLDQPFRASPDDLGLIQYTSGSTSAPKGVALSQLNLASNVHAVGLVLRMNRHDVAVSWCPLYHDMGLIGALMLMIYWRIPLVLMSPLTFLGRPHLWLKAIHEYRATLSIAPNFGYALCTKRVTEEQRRGLDLSSWRCAMNGAEPVTSKVVHEFIRAYEPHGFNRDAIMPVYGLAESTVGVAFPSPGEPFRFDEVSRARLSHGEAVPDTGSDTVSFASVGRAVPGSAIRIVDDNGDPVPDRTIGHIMTAGPSLMSGYFECEEATNRVLRDNWLWTGDLGYSVDGDLFVTGRAKDLIIIRGRNYYAEDIEHHIESVPGARGGGAVAFGVYDDDESRERLVIVCETKLSSAEDKAQLAERISKHILATIGLSVDEIVIVAPNTVPKTSSGKRQRARCREAYLSKNLKTAHASMLQLGMVFLRSKAGMLRLRGRQSRHERPADEG